MSVCVCGGGDVGVGIWRPMYNVCLCVCVGGVVGVGIWRPMYNVCLCVCGGGMWVWVYGDPCIMYVCVCVCGGGCGCGYMETHV